MSAESQPILSGTELKKLIEMLESKTVAFSDADVAWNDDQLETWRLEEAQKALSAARLALEEYVAKLQREIKAMNEMYTEVCAPLQECCQRHELGLGGEFVQDLVVAEVDRLRAGR